LLTVEGAQKTLKVSETFRVFLRWGYF